jgi:diguanylate cyclase (GGDEF)-like protein
MSLLSWFDNRTLFGCQCLLATVFSIVFLWMNREYPQIAGLRWITGGFITGIPTTLLIVARGYVSPFVSITIANALAILTFLLLYEGVARFLHERSHIRVLAILGTSALGVVFYFSEIVPDIVPRILAMGLFTAVICGTAAWPLLGFGLSPGQAAKRGKGQSGFSAGELLGSSLALLCVICVERSLVTVLVGAPQNFMQRDALQTSTMVINLACVAMFGLCFVMMAGQELIACSQAESERDPLSRALNRRGIEARLEVELKRSSRNRQRLSVALVDIDHFKVINDTLGHAGGDEAIRQVARLMADYLRDLDFVGRYGGDEFLMVLPHAGIENASAAVERIAAAVDDQILIGGRHCLTLSIGVTEASPEDDAITLIARADQALYLAKNAGRDCLRVLAPASTFPDGAPSYQPRFSEEA